MSNKVKVKDTRRLGLVEVEVDGYQVVLTMHPPGSPAATVLMSPGDARGLARGLLDGADQAENPSPEANDGT